MKNHVVKHALSALSQPISIGAILLLLLNDHLFKQLWPSWWTGKLSDIAGLIFFPLILAIPLAILLPTNSANARRRVGMVAVEGAGLGDNSGWTGKRSYSRILWS